MNTTATLYKNSWRPAWSFFITFTELTVCFVLTYGLVWPNSRRHFLIRIRTRQILISSCLYSKGGTAEEGWTTRNERVTTEDLECDPPLLTVPFRRNYGVRMWWISTSVCRSSAIKSVVCVVCSWQFIFFFLCMSIQGFHGFIMLLFVFCLCFVFHCMNMKSSPYFWRSAVVSPAPQQHIWGKVSSLRCTTMDGLYCLQDENITAR